MLPPLLLACDILAGTAAGKTFTPLPASLALVYVLAPKPALVYLTKRRGVPANEACHGLLARVIQYAPTKIESAPTESEKAPRHHPDVYAWASANTPNPKARIVAPTKMDNIPSTVLLSLATPPPFYQVLTPERAVRALSSWKACATPQRSPARRRPSFNGEVLPRVQDARRQRGPGARQMLRAIREPCPGFAISTPQLHNGPHAAAINQWAGRHAFHASGTLYRRVPQPGIARCQLSPSAAARPAPCTAPTAPLPTSPKKARRADCPAPVVPAVVSVPPARAPEKLPALHHITPAVPTPLKKR
jgi:hypothetical protein